MNQSALMSQISVFENIPVNEIKRWLNFKDSSAYFDDYLGNRQLYPFAIPQNAQEVEVELAILREVIRRDFSLIYSEEDNQLNIPLELLSRIPSLTKIIQAILEILRLSGVTLIVGAGGGQNVILGSVVTPNNAVSSNQFNAVINGTVMKFVNEKITILPIDSPQVKVSLGDESEVLVSGGKIGVVINLLKQA